MKKVISASRRTDLVAFFPGWLASAIFEGKVRVAGPSGYVYTADLRPEAVHTFVLWSKDFSNLIENHEHLDTALRRYDQLYLLFTITGLGGTRIERHVPDPSRALSQLPQLAARAGNPERISVRFDPIISWREGGKERTNLDFFETLAKVIAPLGIKDVRFSFTQWYGKALRRARKHNFIYTDPSPEKKREAARCLVQVAKDYGLRLYACSQDFLSDVPGINPSACIDGHLLQRLHPAGETASLEKDRSQRPECRCTASVDIGSYSQSCPHSCLYCYANPRMA